MFQYISCCSLSAMAQCNALSNSCFNTSHVVVYLEKIPDIETVDKFQYISCCSLSKNNKIRVSAKYSFQYISCCSLSYSSLNAFRNSS